MVSGCDSMFQLRNHLSEEELQELREYLNSPVKMNNGDGYRLGEL